jgi:arsenical pump membrane protein
LDLVVSLLALVAALAAAVVRPRWLPEAAVAAAGAAAVVGVGAISPAGARQALEDLGPTVGFLAALLVLADGCRREGVFAAIGAWMAAGSRGRPPRLLGLTFAACAGVTAVLGLDATVVLLTPVVFATAARLRTSARPHAYACAHLANSASLVLAVSNLTNLLAFHASRLSFVRFATLMALPWLAAIAIEWVVLRRFFASELERPVVAVGGAAGREGRAAAGAGAAAGVGAGAGAGAAAGARAGAGAGGRPAPAFALAVLALTLVGFALSSALGVAPVWFAAAGAAALTLRGLTRGDPAPAGLVRALEPGFLVFVLGLGVIVAAASQHGLGGAVRSVLPAGGSLGDLLVVAGVSAVLANLVNNLPATLILLPATAALGTGPVLAMLVGVNVGPNLSYAGSLATLLWRRVLRAEETDVELWEFTRLGLLTVPAALVLCSVLVWAGVRGWG